MQGSISRKEFERVIRLLDPRRILTPLEWLENLDEGCPKTSDLCLTFDDGLPSQYEIPLPALERYRLKAFWFVYSCVFEGQISKFEVYRAFRCRFFLDFMAHLKRLVIVQARTGSTRLPGKVVLDLARRPLLARMMERLSRASQPDGIVIATTNEPSDDLIVGLCEREGWECFRGDTADLLDRHYRCAMAYGADIVAKIPSDVPLIDPNIVDATFSLYNQGDFDYVSNLHPPTFPDGLDVEVFSIDALRTAWAEAAKGYEREHTTPYVWDNPERFRLGNLETPNGVDYSLTYRWTIDYPEDYEFLSRVFTEFYAQAPAFTWLELITFLDAHPEVARINADRIGINWYRDHLHDLKHVAASWTQRS